MSQWFGVGVVFCFAWVALNVGTEVTDVARFDIAVLRLSQWLRGFLDFLRDLQGKQN